MHILFKITTATIIEDMYENYRLTLKFNAYTAFYSTMDNVFCRYVTFNAHILASAIKWRNGVLLHFKKKTSNHQMHTIDKNSLRLTGDSVRLLVNGSVGAVGENPAVSHRFCVNFSLLKDT